MRYIIKLEGINKDPEEVECLNFLDESFLNKSELIDIGFSKINNESKKNLFNFFNRLYKERFKECKTFKIYRLNDDYWFKELESKIYYLIVDLYRMKEVYSNLKWCFYLFLLNRKLRETEVRRHSYGVMIYNNNANLELIYEDSIQNINKIPRKILNLI